MTAPTTAASPPPPPYLELFGCLRATTDDGCDCDQHDWGFSCNLCGQPITDRAGCPRHAPMEIPGLQRIECDAGHPVTFVHASEGYPAPCMYCAWDAEAKAHSGCRHSHHHKWRSWKLTRRADHLLAMLGVGHFTSARWGGGCNGCHTRWRWGSGMILWRPAEWWGCLLLRHHRRTELGCWGEPLGICAICCPCPGCEYCTDGPT